MSGKEVLTVGELIDQLQALIAGGISRDIPFRVWGSSGIMIDLKPGLAYSPPLGVYVKSTRTR